MAADFKIIPGTIRFGADHAYTCITAYLEPTATLAVRVQKTIYRKFKDSPVAYICVYDMEYARMSLVLVYADHAQYEARIRQLECNALYQSLCSYVKNRYGVLPETMLNTYREGMGLPPI